ncbi:MAG: glycosyltransferase family 4 protein [Planctomycetes bacterium]|nr:glycosyltransferase family 4 protein [Planctomycetota bacterium]
MGLRIALDASAAAKRERTGVARYAACLIDALLAAAPDWQFTLGCRLSRLRRHRYRLRPRAANARTRYFTDASVRLCLGAADVFHGLDARIPPRCPCPAVVTLHDLGPLERPEIAAAGFRGKKLAAYQVIAARSARIICVSDATRDAFRRAFDLPEERFAVIHHGLEPRFRPQTEQAVEAALRRLGIARPYLLFVGLLSARKNCAALVRAFDRMAEAVPGLRLVLAGGRAHGFAEVEQALAAARARARIVLLGFVEDELLPPLYAGARAFVFPGRNEGFGLPMLEAMACGAPVMAADTAVAREVAGGAALLADTGVEGAFAAALARICSERALAEELSARGALRAKEFSWQAAALRTLEVYRAAAAASVPLFGRGS